MKVLIDTHTLIWHLLDHEKISRRALRAIASSDQVYVSAASAWELSTKYRSGRLPEVEPLISDYDRVLTQANITVLLLTFAHGIRAGLLDSPHKDPFDRMIAAQALVEDLDVVTLDPKIAELGAKVVW